ncbi:MAG: hypothetical protein H6732_09955 [Alphaproteobacteria bacterium]|nr:hypothetical protein [Alphaproteobacteria bacterium]
MTRSRLALLLPLLAGACDRGAWWWGKFDAPEPGSIAAFHAAAMGSTAPAVPNASDLAPVLDSCWIERLYGSYGSLPQTDPQWMWEWNSALHAWDVKSYYLLADPAWIEDSAPLIGLLDQRIGWWTKAPVGLTPNAFFDGLHLDLEPVQFPACKTATLDPVACRALHDGLLQTITDVRSWIDANASYLELYVDLHHWTDVVSGGRVDWSTGLSTDPATNRTAWYTQLAAQVDGITVMAYHPNPVTLVSRVAWEFANVPTEVRVGMDVDDYAGIPFNGTDGLMDVALGLELGEGQRVDVHRFNDLVVAGGCL